MADRSIKLILKAEVNDFKRSLGEASKSLSDVGGKATETAKKSDTALGQMVQSAARHEQAWTKVGTTLLVAGAAIAAGIGLAVAKYAEFDSSMSQAQAATQATGAALGDLRQAAIDGGAATQYSATEAAKAITEMGKAGVSTKDILGGGLTGALSLAAAGQIEVGRAGEIAAVAMTQFNLAGSDLPHIADLLAAGAGKAVGGVEDLANALKFVGPIAEGLGVSIDETTGTLAEFASKGIIGEQAGTSMRGMLLSLTSPSKTAAKEMETLGLNVYDAQGKFIGMQSVAGELASRLGKLTDAERNESLGRIFGNEQITAARILYDGGAGAVATWTAKVNDSGFAARQAAALTDNLSGDLDRLQGSLDTALIQTGSNANSVLRDMTQSLTGVINGFVELPSSTQATALGIAAVVAGVALLGGAFLVGAPKALAFKASIDELATTNAKAATAMRGLTLAAGIAIGVLAVAAIGVSVWASANAAASAKASELADTLDQQTGALSKNSTAWIQSELTKDQSFGINNSKSMAEAADQMGISLDTLTKAYMGQAPAMAEAKDAAQSWMDSNFSLSQKNEGMAQRFMRNIDDQGARIVTAEGIVKSKLAVDEAATGAQGNLADAYTATTVTTVTQAEALTALIEVQNAAAGIVLSERDAQRGLEEAYASATKAIEDNGRTLDITTEKGRANQGALDAISKAGWDLIASMDANHASQEDMQGVMSTTRERFLAVADSMGMGTVEAATLADQLGLIPANVTAAVVVDTATAAVNSANITSMLYSTPNINRTVTVDTAAAMASLAALHQSLYSTPQNQGVLVPVPKKKVATGGYIAGPGTGTSDSIPAMLSNGEFVIKADTVQKYGSGFFNNLNAQRFASGGLVGGGSSSSTIPGASTMTNDITINEVTDPVGTSRAIMRRLSGLAA